MKSIKQDKSNNNHPYSDKIVHGNSLEIAETTTEKNLIESGSHALLVYNGMEAFREIYTQYSRALLPQNEGRQGVTWFGDPGSFFSFEKIEELMQYELSLPQKYKDSIKIVCSYHLRDFEKLTEAQQHILFDHHSKSIVVE